MKATSREESPPAGTHCPRCSLKGRAVQEVTLEALLSGPALARRSVDRHRFCPQATCPVVYFAPGEEFTVEDVATPVFLKEPPGNRLVCPCFGVTEDDIRRGMTAAGHSTAQEKIAALVKAGRCACELRNPQGSCCLGNIAMIVKSAAES